ncbi:cytochrome protein [Xylaria intraflava]|nr:cytochrome protein [Xylaria intraflava]
MTFIGTLGAGVVFAMALVLSARITLIMIFSKKPGPLPPGPKGLPFVGNVNDLPPPGQRECEHWIKHKDIYGPISSVTVLGTTIVILNSSELAVELLDRKSAVYSSRPRLPFADITGLGSAMPMLPYNKMLRYQRKLIYTFIGSPAAATTYIDVQEKEAHRFLLRVLQRPESFLDHIRTEAGAIILKTVYGYTVEPHKSDPLVKLIGESMEHFAAAVVPGAWLVDVIPALQYIPEWMPGTGWKETSKKWRNTIMETAEKPLLFARKRRANGHAEKSYVGKFYDDRGDDLSPDDCDTLKWTALSLFGGGADTTVNMLSAFFLAMILYPDVQRKAQEEIDQVIGTGRLPMYSDRDRLPYVDAVVTEAWRWHPVVPLNTPHTSDAEHFVNGYYIPKGALVMANIWAFTHDPVVYPDPSAFNPLRYLGPNSAPNPTKHVFGYGRRICPGRHIAMSSVWITIAQSLAVLNIKKGLDANGREIEPTVASTPGLVSRPEEFKATIKPRSPQHEVLIRQAEELHPWEKSGADEL